MTHGYGLLSEAPFLPLFSLVFAILSVYMEFLIYFFLLQIEKLAPAQVIQFK